jgi:hypothetical protein
MRRAFASMLSFAAAAFVADPALACSYAEAPRFELRDDPNDTTPPAAPEARIRKIKRGVDGDSEGCGGGAESSCDDLGYVDVQLPSLDEETGVVLVLSGAYPKNLREQIGPVSPGYERSVRLVWIDGAGDADLDFDIEVWSVDRAGNMSETATRLAVNDDDGCSAGRRRAPHGMWLGLLGVFLLVRRARARGRPM